MESVNLVASIPTIIVVAIYNRDTYIVPTIESILAQTDRNFTLLLCDDGSTDNSAQIAQQYADKDPRIQLILAPHQGAAPALQAAIAHTQSDYIACIDSDDLLHPTALTTALILHHQNPHHPITLLTNQAIPPHWNHLPIQIQPTHFPATWQHRETALLNLELAEQEKQRETVVGPWAPDNPPKL